MAIFKVKEIDAGEFFRRTDNTTKEPIKDEQVVAYHDGDRVLSLAYVIDCFGNLDARPRTFLPLIKGDFEHDEIVICDETSQRIL